jgi:hypothetical protein
VQHLVDEVAAASGEAEDRGVVLLALASFAGVVGPVLGSVSGAAR